MRFFIVLTFAFLLLPDTDSAAQVEAPRSAVEIVDWRWFAEPDFGTDGAVRWFVQVANDSRRTIYQAEVKFTSLDESGNALASDFDMVQRVAPGDTATIDARADYLGSEEKARVRVSNVYFENR
jgi:hypothetical protein